MTSAGTRASGAVNESFPGLQAEKDVPLHIIPRSYNERFLPIIHLRIPRFEWFLPMFRNDY